MAELVVMLLLFLLISGIVGIFAWPYALNTWLLYLGKVAVVTAWQGFLLGLVPVLGPAGFPFAVVTWIASLFLA